MVCPIPDAGLKNAEDLVQDASVKVLATKRQRDEEFAYRTWLFRIVKNAYIDTTVPASATSNSRARRLATDRDSFGFPVVSMEVT